MLKFLATALCALGGTLMTYATVFQAGVNFNFGSEVDLFDSTYYFNATSLNSSKTLINPIPDPVMDYNAAYKLQPAQWTVLTDGTLGTEAGTYNSTTYTETQTDKTAISCRNFTYCTFTASGLIAGETYYVVINGNALDTESEGVIKVMDWTHKSGFTDGGEGTDINDSNNWTFKPYTGQSWHEGTYAKADANGNLTIKLLPDTTTGKTRVTTAMNITSVQISGNWQSSTQQAADSAAAYKVWLAKYFSAADIAAGTKTDYMADPDGDGVVNLIEFALYSDPTKPTRVNVPEGEEGYVITGMQRDTTNNTEALYIKFRIAHESAPYVDYVVEWSGDLQTWTQNYMRLPSYTEQTDRVITVTSDFVNASSPRRKFVRLRVVLRN